MGRRKNSEKLASKGVNEPINDYFKKNEGNSSNF